VSNAFKDKKLHPIDILRILDPLLHALRHLRSSMDAMLLRLLETPPKSRAVPVLSQIKPGRIMSVWRFGTPWPKTRPLPAKC
jgi:hypothetical protein